MGDPKSIKNHEKSILAPSRVPLSASVPNLITKMVSKDLQMDPKWFPGDPKKHKNQQNPIIKYITNRFTFSFLSIDFNPAN